MQQKQQPLITKIQFKSFGNQVIQQGHPIKSIKGVYGKILCQNKLYLVKQIQTRYLQQTINQHFQIFNTIINIQNHKHISTLYRHLYDNLSSHYLFQQYNQKLINLYQYQQKNNQNNQNDKNKNNQKDKKDKNKNKEISTLKLQQAKDILQQIIYGLSQIHQAGLIHQNLNFYNIILSSEIKKISKHELYSNIWKLTNFGVKKNISQYMIHQQWNKQKQQFLSPQIYQVDRKYSYQVDIWALGVLFYYMLSGRFPFNIPFKKSKQEKRMCLIKQAQQYNKQKLIKDLAINKSCEKEIDKLYDLFINIFKVNKYQRLSFLDLYRNKYSILKGILYQDPQKATNFYQKVYKIQQQSNKKQSSVNSSSANSSSVNSSYNFQISQMKNIQSIYVSKQQNIKQ